MRVAAQLAWCARPRVSVGAPDDVAWARARKCMVSFLHSSCILAAAVRAAGQQQSRYTAGRLATRAGPTQDSLPLAPFPPPPQYLFLEIQDSCFLGEVKAKQALVPPSCSMFSSKQAGTRGSVSRRETRTMG